MFYSGGLVLPSECNCIGLLILLKLYPALLRLFLATGNRGVANCSHSVVIYTYTCFLMCSKEVTQCGKQTAPRLIKSWSPLLLINWLMKQIRLTIRLCPVICESWLHTTKAGQTTIKIQSKKSFVSWVLAAAHFFSHKKSWLQRILFHKKSCLLGILFQCLI